MFFRSRLSKEWNTNKTPTILEDIAPGHFDDYIACTHSLQSMSGHGESDYFTQLFDIYVLADRFGDSAAMNTIADEAVKHSDSVKKVPAWKALKPYLAQLPVTSPLYRIMVDMYMQEASRGGLQKVLDDEKDEATQTFLVAVAETYLREKPDKNAPAAKPLHKIFYGTVSGNPKCHYHQHDQLCLKCQE